MQFASLTYLVHLCLTFGIYWGIPRRRVQNVVILLASYAFYSWWDYRYCALMAASSVIDYAAGLALARSNVGG